MRDLLLFGAHSVAAAAALYLFAYLVPPPLTQAFKKGHKHGRHATRLGAKHRANLRQVW